MEAAARFALDQLRIECIKNGFLCAWGMSDKNRFAEAAVECRVDRLWGEAGDEGFDEDEDDAIETCCASDVV